LIPDKRPSFHLVCRLYRYRDSRSRRHRRVSSLYHTL